MKRLVGIVVLALCSACGDDGGSDGPEEAGTTGMDTADSASPDGAESSTGGDDSDGSGTMGDDDGSSSTSDGGETGSSSSGEPVDQWHRIQIELVEEPGGAVLNNVPVLVLLTPDRVDYDLMAEDGADLRFVNADDLRLRHEIEAWNPGGTSVVWVNLPTVGGVFDSSFTLEYGRPPPDEPLLYGWNGYSSVWHMQGDPSDAKAVSPDSGGAHDLHFYETEDGIEAIDGVLDQGVALTSGDLLRTWTSYSPLHFQEEFTLEAWVRPGETSRGDIAGQSLSIALSIGTDGVARAGMRPYGESGWDWVASEDPLPVGEWSYMVATLTSDPSILRLYVDGEQVDAYTHFYDVHTNHGGNVFNVYGDVEADIDEVRLSLVGHSEDWVRLQYLSMTDALLSFGPTEAIDLE